jgi:UDP-N-acetylmuramoyl-L-alanyl-D-glutamate--2,6-diaminopimelate ligase
MPEALLSTLIDGLPGLAAAPAGAADPVIRGLAYDSRRAAPGFLFAALGGVHTDGRRFIGDAAARGAAAVLIEDAGAKDAAGLPAIRVTDARLALSFLADRFHGAPSRDLYVIGVTGTDGKSSTVSFIHQLLELLGLPAGFLSTVAVQTGDTVADNPFRQSTPEAPEIHGLLAAMRDQGKRFAVIEATSHGLSDKTRRLAHVRFDAAVFTNVALEHLEFHGTVERYRDDKVNLFRALACSGDKRHGLPRAAVVNGGDPHAGLFLAAARTAGVTPMTFGLAAVNADWRAGGLRPSVAGTDFTVDTGGRSIAAVLSVPGAFNVENFLAAAAVVCAATGRAPEEVLPLGASLRPVPGRVETVVGGQPFRVIVDFAHTPQAFGKLIPAFREETRGRLIVLFGSAGERDTTKRRLQGEAASRHADVIILTDEDPRGEDRSAILEEIAAGCAGKVRGENLLLIPDRREAIERAFRTAGAGDTVLLLGKGHEKSIIYATGPVAWNERAVAEEILAALGYRR